jgi:Ser/Thr protein kinase RdoA (MazF antagonist)
MSTGQSSAREGSPPEAGPPEAGPPEAGTAEAGTAESPEQILLGYDPFARAALQPFGFSGQAQLSLLSLSENATYRIDDPRDGRTAVLRVHRTGYHEAGAVASELAWLQALRRDEGLLTPAVFRAPDGRDVVDVAIGPVTRQTVLFEWLPGTEPPEDQLAEKFELLGGICARMHRHSRRWARPAGFVRFTWDFDCCVGESARWGRWQDGIGVGKEELQTLGRAAALISERLRRFGAGPDRFGLIHADMRLANLLVSGPDIQVIDFDDCGFGWLLFDIGASLSFIEHDPRVPALCDAWLRGYRGVLPLPDEDATEIPTFVLLRRLQLVAWVGSHRFADSARELGADFTSGACELAERYLLTTS